MNTQQHCPIWNSEATTRTDDRTKDLVVDSPRAGGEYRVELEAMETLAERDNRFKARLTSLLVDQRRLGVGCPIVTRRTIETAAARRDMRVTERADRILTYLEGVSGILGARLEFRLRATDSPDYLDLLTWSESLESEELLFLVNLLSQRGLVSVTNGYNEVKSCSLTFEGYERLIELEDRHVVSSTAFVAMWFHDSTNDPWELGIEPAIRQAGYEAVRVDEKEHINKIDDEIIAEIRRCRFVVADFTQGDAGARGGVYYEAGFAQGLGLPVVFTCRKDVLEEVHFDTRQYNHITWKDPADLRERLFNRIAAVIGERTAAVGP